MEKRAIWVQTSRVEATGENWCQGKPKIRWKGHVKVAASNWKESAMSQSKEKVEGNLHRKDPIRQNERFSKYIHILARMMLRAINTLICY